jgi:hypothetical protein
MRILLLFALVFGINTSVFAQKTPAAHLADRYLCKQELKKCGEMLVPTNNYPPYDIMLMKKATSIRHIKSGLFVQVYALMYDHRWVYVARNRAPWARTISLNLNLTALQHYHGGYYRIAMTDANPNDWDIAPVDISQPQKIKMARGGGFVICIEPVYE